MHTPVWTRHTDTLQTTWQGEAFHLRRQYGLWNLHRGPSDQPPWLAPHRAMIGLTRHLEPAKAKAALLLNGYIYDEATDAYRRHGQNYSFDDLAACLARSSPAPQTTCIYHDLIEHYRTCDQHPDAWCHQRRILEVELVQSHVRQLLASSFPDLRVTEARDRTLFFTLDEATPLAGSVSVGAYDDHFAFAPWTVRMRNASEPTTPSLMSYLVTSAQIPGGLTWLATRLCGLPAISPSL